MTDYTLVLEGATYAGSVALLRDGELISERTLADQDTPVRDGRDERVLPSVAECLAECGVKAGEIARVICGAGPGSFTSLRISASVAKGIAVGVGCPVFSVSSLLLSVAACPTSLPAGRYLSVLPAMRGDWFALSAKVDREGAIVSAGEAALISGDNLADAAGGEGATILGPGQAIDSRPHARGAAILLDRILAGEPVDIETWEPDYGRLAEAQVRWEAAHGRPLGAGA